MNEPIGFRGIFSKKEFFCVFQNCEIVFMRLQVLPPEAKDFSIALDVIRKIAKTWLRSRGMFGMIFNHPQHVGAQSRTVQGCLSVRTVVPDENHAFVHLFRCFLHGAFEFLGLRFGYSLS